MMVIFYSSLSYCIYHASHKHTMDQILKRKSTILTRGEHLPKTTLLSQYLMYFIAQVFPTETSHLLLGH